MGRDEEETAWEPTQGDSPIAPKPKISLNFLKQSTVIADRKKAM